MLILIREYACRVRCCLWSLSLVVKHPSSLVYVTSRFSLHCSDSKVLSKFPLYVCNNAAFRYLRATPSFFIKIIIIFNLHSFTYKTFLNTLFSKYEGYSKKKQFQTPGYVENQTYASILAVVSLSNIQGSADFRTTKYTYKQHQKAVLQIMMQALLIWLKTRSNNPLLKALSSRQAFQCLKKKWFPFHKQRQLVTL